VAVGTFVWIVVKGKGGILWLVARGDTLNARKLYLPRGETEKQGRSMFSEIEKFQPIKSYDACS
jgi:hypothetical protein